jgi:NAD(P)-dependent dehydrogenase (short-subunit alcohol dehydrogenase family)
MSQSLKNKIALVTGASRNVGREIALRLADDGADVVFTYLSNTTAADGTLRDLRARGVRAHAIKVNLTGTGELDAFVAELRGVVESWGRNTIDILVNNAGILRLATFDKVTEDDLDANYLTNYKSVFFLTQKLAPLLAEGGRIVNLGSRTAKIAFAPLVSYGPVKAAIQSLTPYLASFFGKRGITVNAVSPGGLDDDFNTTLFERMPQARDYIKSQTAVGRMGVPSDVAGVVAFLCSPAAGFVSGAVVQIDGGYHL